MERCAVVGIGQTKHTAARKDVSMPGLVREAAERALADAGLEWKDIDAVVIGKAPDMFEGVMMPELFLHDALGGAYKKANVSPKATLRELRVTPEYAASVEVGQALALDQVFEVGQYVDVQGVTRGRGFTGVMRRYNFPVAPVIIGMILGPIAEKHFRAALSISQGDPRVFVTHPLSAAILGLAVLLVALPWVWRRLGRRGDSAAGASR